MPGAMEGVRVLDLTTMVAGPVATMMLADQGAEVIKVESPHGDLMRHFSRGRNGMNAAFLSCNRNKRSLAVDLKSADGLEILKRLIATAQVFVHNFRPGIAERMGLGEEIVRAIRRDIVYVSITGYGTKGPYANQRAYDPVIQAMSGLADIQRDRDTGRPRMVRTIIADYTTALTAAQAITAALFARERTGGGQHVRISMLDAMISYLWPEAMPSLTFVGDETDPSDGEVGPDLVFATQDRYITAAALSDDEWAGMCRALNRQELIDDLRFKTARDRSVNAVERRTITSAELEKWRADEILPRLLANDVPSAPVVSRFELLHDKQVSENHILEEFDSEQFGKVRMPRPAALFDRTPAKIRALAPRLGADNAAILAELGYDADDITRLESNKVVHNSVKKESAGG
ncbi:MAG: CoA transferase [Candidatus Binatus sp.]|jgi:crotonobetainyl-CoA:carnitine CoA-transferase CaiB-like acyl-CoA transferase|uniref:CaiB/BaiF CoA transferase family protein n=2 Tax=Candidatus Binatus sp. TaxID=2811406 RepID=UPI003C775834